MKFATSSFLVLVLSLCTLQVLGQQLPSETDVFDAIKASAGVTVYVKQGPEHRIRVTGDDDDLENLMIETRGSTLHIYYESSGWNLFKSNIGDAKVYVQVVDITSIDASSGAEVKSEGPLKAETLSLSVSSGAEINLEVNVGSLSMESSSGAEMELSGTAANAAGSSSSGSEIEAFELTAKSATLSASSGGEIELTVTESINAKASSGGDITLKGNPETRNVEKSSGGGVNFR